MRLRFGLTLLSYLNKWKVSWNADRVIHIIGIFVTINFFLIVYSLTRAIQQPTPIVFSGLRIEGATEIYSPGDIITIRIRLPDLAPGDYSLNARAVYVTQWETESFTIQKADK